MTAHDKIVQYLNEAHALEGALVQTLTVHISVTPEGRYRDLLERHLGETRDHARAIEERLGQIGATRNPFALGMGIIETLIGQVVAAGKAPWDLVRGSGGEEKLLKNAKDEIASEALEIATYDNLEALAEALGDNDTAELARRHRADEERTLQELRELIPALTEAVVAADVLGIGSYDASSTGAADAVKAAARTAREKAGDAAGEARGAADDARTGARRTASRARSSARRTTARATSGSGSSSRSRSTSSRARSGSGSSSSARGRSNRATTRGSSGSGSGGSSSS
jgi:ferritin-like metal-binding protein YciE